MYVMINKKKIKIEKADTFFKRLKGFMFKFDTIDYGLCFPKCKSIHTYLMCQDIDIVMTDKDDKILYMYPKFKSEKIILPKRGVYYTYELPLNSCRYLKVNEILQVKK